MIVDTRRKNGFIKTKNLIDDGVCNYCFGTNIKNDRCYDCMNTNSLLYFYKRDIAKKNHVMKLKFELSEKQIEASLFFREHYIAKKNAFLNAVCGSGKTEIMYETILYALNNNDKVLIGIPRREIVNELKERLDSVFINTNIKVLDMNHHDMDCDLLISTINQLIHFENEFDLIIVDEADAYPYNTSPYLKRLVTKALKKNGVLFLMSATTYGEIPYDKFTINRRYHKHDLSTPKFIRLFSFDEKIEYIKNLINTSDRKFIIYVSSINLSYKISDILNAYQVSSLSKNSKAIIDELRSGKEKVLISTTLLERGITVKGVDVIIFDTDNIVFTHQTIIQICGRVGRSTDDYSGNIYCLYKYNSIKFDVVKRYIKRMNEM